MMVESEFRQPTPEEMALALRRGAKARAEAFAALFHWVGRHLIPRAQENHPVAKPV